MKSLKNPIVSIDIAKLVFAVIIPCLHITQFLKPGMGYFFGQYPGRLGVPFFFCCSGFLLQRRIRDASEHSSSNGERTKIVLKQAARIMKLFLVWELIYLPVSVVEHWDGDFVSSSLSWLHYQLFAADGALWFLLAMVVGLLLYWLIQGRKRYWLAMFLFACGLLLDSYAFLLPEPLVNEYYSIFLTAKNALFEAFPYLVLGSFIVEKSETNIKRPAVKLLISFAFLMLEIYLTKTYAPPNPHKGLYLFIPFVLLYLFDLLLNNEIQCKAKLSRILERLNKSNLSVSRISLYLRKSSMGIYLMQVWVISLCTVAAGDVALFANGYLQWLLVLIVGFLFGYLSLKHRFVANLF